MNKDEVLKMVIDNLELQEMNNVNATLIAYCKEALDTKRVCENEAQPAQEPAAIVMPIHVGDYEHNDVIDRYLPPNTPLYTHPAPLQNEFAKTTSWQGLSDDEIYKCQHPEYPDTMYFARAIEQALRNKNGY